MEIPKYVVSYSTYCGCPNHDPLGFAVLKKIFTNKELFEFIHESVDEFEITDILPISTETAPTVEYVKCNHRVECVRLNFVGEPQLFFPWRITSDRITDCLDDNIGIAEAVSRISTV